MPEYLSPGVYVEEVDAGPKPIAPVATSTAGAVGITQRGPTTPTLITSYADFVRRFSGPLPTPDEATQTQWANRGHWWHAAESVKAFFDEGGARMYFQRAWSADADASNAAFGGGLHATLLDDIETTSTSVRLNHVFGIQAGGTLQVTSVDGISLGTMNVTDVDYATRTVTIAPPPFSARGGRDRVVIRPVDANLDVLRFEASSVGSWGDDLRVQVNAMIGGRLLLEPAPTSGGRVSTPMTAAAVGGATVIVVAPVAGALDQNTPAPFLVRINGGPPVNVTGVALSGAGPNIALTVPALGAALPVGSTVDMLRPSGGPPTTLGSTQTTAAANAGDTTIEVAPAAGALVQNTPTPFPVRIDGGAPVNVTGVAQAGGGPNLALTLTTPLPANVAVGANVDVLQPAATLTVSNAARLYEGAIVQLEGFGGTELRVVQGVVDAQVTLDAAPGNAYVEGDAVTLLEAEVQVSYHPAGGSEETERFQGLRLTDSPDPASMIEVINLRSQFIRLERRADWDGDDLDRFPATVPAWAALDNGDDAFAALTVRDVIGQNLGPGQRTGIQALEEIDQVAIALVPGWWSEDVRNALILHCESLADRFAILDPPPGQSVQQIEAFRSPIDTKYAALYYPWVEVLDPRPGGDQLELPPSGFIAGIYARTDIARGVHKAPANETIRSIRGLAQRITKREQDVLNPQNINVLRLFVGRGNRVWGARVLTSDPAWRYVNVRRLFLMIEESIDEGTQWVVFEPNDEPLWARVRQTVTRFLFTQWRLGALQGTTADEAFFVGCDRSTMTQEDIDNGRLIAVVGIAPVKPAEFVIFRIQQKTLELTTA